MPHLIVPVGLCAIRTTHLVARHKHKRLQGKSKGIPAAVDSQLPTEIGGVIEFGARR